MARRVSLPVTDKLLDSVGLPTLSAMRSRLGGRMTSDVDVDDALPIGSIVSFAGDAPDSPAAAPTRLGVVLALGPLDADVYLTRGMVKRTLRSLLHLHTGEAPVELAALRPAIEAFARLEEHQRVWFDRGDGHICEGTLLEKCRYGALVGDDEGKVLGVGFRKLYASPPVPTGAN
ncbi:MAG: hypothetical protein U0414_13900 [Polyangiaceae bacterium]